MEVIIVALIAYILWKEYAAFKSSQRIDIIYRSLLETIVHDGEIEERVYPYIDNIAYICPHSEYKRVIGSLCSTYGIRLQMDDDDYLIDASTRKLLAQRMVDVAEDYSRYINVQRSQAR